MFNEIDEHAKIKNFLKENDIMALDQIKKAITSEMQFREALWAGRVVPSHAAEAMNHSFNLRCGRSFSLYKSKDAGKLIFDFKSKYDILFLSPMGEEQ